MSSYLKVIFSFSLFAFLYYIFYLFVVLSTQVTVQTWDENTTCGSHYSFSTLCVQSVDVRPSGWCLYPLSLTSSLGILIVHKPFPFLGPILTFPFTIMSKYVKRYERKIKWKEFLMKYVKH